MSAFGCSFSLSGPVIEPQDAEDCAPCLGALAWRPTLRKRNAVRYLAVRAWRAHAKAHDIRLLTDAKRAATIPVAVVQGAAADIASVIGPLGLAGAGWSVANVATGHSRRPDALAPQIADAVAGLLALPRLQMFEDRYVSGVSHPKEFRNLPPLVVRERPAGPVLLVDDVATSGWHMEEALGVIRGMGVAALGIAWIGGVVT